MFAPHKPHPLALAPNRPQPAGWERMLLRTRERAAWLALATSAGLTTTAMLLVSRPEADAEHGIAIASGLLVAAIGALVALAFRTTNQQKREHSQETISIAGGVAHGFNNQLTAILGHVGQVRDELERLGVSDHIVQDLDGIELAADECANVTSNLLAFAAPHPGRKESLQLDDLLRQRLTSPNRVEGSLAVYLTVDTPGVTVTADREWLLRIFDELLANAALAVADHVRVRVVAEPVTQGAPALTRISFIDDGEGIAQQDLARIFEPFFTTRGLASARGLGLAAVEGLVTAMGGEVTATSEVGRGTEVSFTLPLRDQASARRRLVG